MNRHILALVVLVGGWSTVMATPPTFSKDIAPILFANCTTCHRPDAIGPFPITNYSEAKKRAKQIALVTGDLQMPPWKPVAGHGEFRDERRLSKDQIRLIAEWVEAGAPEGDPKQTPPVPKFKSGWQLGKPDLILKLPEPHQIPAEGRDVYWQFVFPLDLSKDVYLRGVECRPSNLRVAHHALGILDSSGTARKLDAKYPGPGYPGIGPGFVPAGFTPGYGPGYTPRFYDDECTITLKKGTDFVLQMHYHPTGKVEYDETEVGLYFAKRAGKKSMVVIGMASEEIDIPAGDTDYQARDRFKLPVDMEVANIWSHLHTIGKTVRVTAELPNGERRKLLSIQDWDFNWQDTYLYQKPFWLPKGTIVRAEWSWDNSAKNPRNPFSPPKRMRFGEGTNDEMSGVIIGGTVKNDLEALSHWAAVIGHYLEIKARGLPYSK